MLTADDDSSETNVQSEQLCFKYQENGNCSFGDKCRFDHRKQCKTCSGNHFTSKHGKGKGKDDDQKGIALTKFVLLGVMEVLAHGVINAFSLMKPKGKNEKEESEKTGERRRPLFVSLMMRTVMMIVRTQTLSTLHPLLLSLVLRL